MRRIIVGLVIFVLVISACGPLALETPVERGWRCPPVSPTFQEGDLVGTWVSRYFPGSVTDTIILQKDRTYREIYENDLADKYIIISGTWYLETRPDGGLYLHLEGMDYRPGGGRVSGVYYDRCSGELVGTIDEVILAVTGDEGFRYPRIEYVPRGILLWHMRVEPDCTDNFFILQEDIYRSGK